MKSIINSAIITYFVGAHYEVSGSTITKYYYAGSQRIAMRSNGTLNYLLGDHLGSTSLTIDAAGNKISELRYKAWGEVRYASGNMSTKYQYTGQFSYEAEFGLYFYNARWYDSYLNHFTQPDSIVPDPYNSQAWDRYAYALNNPLKYTDPTGHKYCLKDDKCDDNLLTGSGKDFFRNYKGYSPWERNVLRRLYEKGGTNAQHGVLYILENDIHITTGNLLFNLDKDRDAWFSESAKTIVLNANSYLRTDSALLTPVNIESTASALLTKSV